MDTVIVSRAFPGEDMGGNHFPFAELKRKRSLGCKSSDKLYDPQNFNVPFIVSGADQEVNSNALESFGFLVSGVKAAKCPARKKQEKRKLLRG